MKIFLAILAYIITFAILTLTGIAIEALGTFLFTWQTQGAFFAPFAIAGAIAGFLASLAAIGSNPSQLEARRDGMDPVGTWTHLTTSNPAWDRIDWAVLYERPALLRHVPSSSAIYTKIASKGPYTVGYDEGPRKIPTDQALLLKALPKMTHSSLHGATQAALEDRDGWALYVVGDLPLRK